MKINYDVLLFTAGLSLLTGIVFGLAPSLHAAKLDLRDVLNQTARGSSGGSHSVRLRSVLVVSEVALAMVLLVGAGLLIQSFLRLEAVKPGFNPEKLLVVDIPLSTRAYSTPQKQTQFYDELLRRLHAMPGVHSVGAASVLPITGGGGQIHFNIAGRPPKDPKEFILAGYRAISPGYFQTLEIPLLAGRTFSEADQANTQNVVMINTAMAKQFFPGINPIGQKLQLERLPEKEFPYMDVIGVVGDVKQTLATDPISEMYIPYSQMPEIVAVTQVSVVLRGEGDPLALVGEFREAVQQINPRSTAGEDSHDGTGNERHDCGAAFPHAFAGNTGCAGFVDFRDRSLRRGFVFGDAAHAGNRHSHGAGSAIGRRAENGVEGRTGAGAVGNCDRRRRHLFGVEGDGEFSFWSRGIRSAHVFRRGDSACAGRPAGLLHSGAARDASGSDDRAAIRIGIRMVSWKFSGKTSATESGCWRKVPDSPFSR